MKRGESGSFHPALLTVEETLRLHVWDADRLTDGVRDAEAVGEKVAVRVGDQLRVPVGEGLGVPVGDGEAVREAERRWLAVGVGEPEREGLGVAVPVKVAVSD